MILVWVGILVLAFSWLQALPVLYGLEGATRWFVVGAALIVLGLRKVEWFGEGRHRGMWIAVFVSSIVGMFWLDGPFRAGFLLLGLAAILASLPVVRPVGRWVSPGLFVAGTVHVLQAACVPLLYVFCSRYHETAEIPFLHDFIPGFPSIPWLAALLLIPLKILSPGTALDGSTLYIATSLDTVPMTPTWEKLGLIPAVLFAVGSMFVVSLRAQWRRRLAGLALWILVFLYVRLLIVSLVVAHTHNERLLWQFDPLFLGFLPLPLLVGAWWQWGGEKGERAPSAGAAVGSRATVARFVRWLRGDDAPQSDFTTPQRTGRVLFAAFLFVAGTTAYWSFHDPGTRKTGRVLIDEGHSNWEWTTLPFDTTWYGGKSGYNYYCLADYWNHFYQVDSRADPLTPELLEQWDVLVIKTPTSGFSPQEIDAIVEFVRDGGGLFLIGDHTNVFGTSTHLNPLAERFGMYFRYDSTYNLMNLGLSLYERPRRFAHPVVRFMPNYLFATSCSMYAPLLSENVMLGYGLRAMYLDYSEISYFPVKENKLDYDFGLFVQAGGVKYGKGRVLGFTDSTCFSNFFMFMPGKPELALASIEWLNRENRWAWRNKVFLVVGLIGMILLLVEARRISSASFWCVVVATGTLALVGVGALTDRSAARSYALPAPHTQPVYVAFDQAHGNYTVPAERLSVINWQNFQTFYVWTQRLGLVPRNDDSLEDAVVNSRALVEINPGRPYSIDDIDRVIDFVRRGGTLLVLDSPENVRSTSNSLLGPFAVAFDGLPADSIAVLDAVGDTVDVARKAVGVKGVAPIWTLADGRTAMGYRTFGAGKVVACGASYLFSSESMGTTATVPDENTRRLYEAEYHLFGELAGLRVRGRYMAEGSPGATEELPHR